MTSVALTRLVWGRCFSVVSAGIDGASEALDHLAGGDVAALRELEALGSERARHRQALLSDRRARPVGPYSSLVLDALSISTVRPEFDDRPFSGWYCHLNEGDAMQTAAARMSEILKTSAARGQSMRLQVYSARIAGRFARSADVQPAILAADYSFLLQRGADGIVLDDLGPGRGAALVFRGSAISQVRPVRQTKLNWDGEKIHLEDVSSGEVPDEQENGDRSSAQQRDGTE